MNIADENTNLAFIVYRSIHQTKYIHIFKTIKTAKQEHNIEKNIYDFIGPKHNKRFVNYNDKCHRIRKHLL